MNNKEQFKRIINLLASTVIVAMFTLAFSEVWNNSYNEIMEDPFWKNGNILLVALYAVLYVFMGSFFGAGVLYRAVAYRLAGHRYAVNQRHSLYGNIPYRPWSSVGKAYAGANGV